MNPQYWCSLHDKALNKLGADWIPLSQLKDNPSEGATVFDDLVAWRRAEVRREPVVRFGIVSGSLTSYRRIA